MNKNTKLIAIVTGFIVVALIVAAILANSNNKSNNTTQSGQVKQTPKQIKVLEEHGSMDALSKKKLSVRNVKFGAKYKNVIANEKKQKDTLDKYSEASSQDGYTYVSYKFDGKKVKNFWGVKPNVKDPSCMLTYVFYKKRLIELRIQYGKQAPDAVNKAVKNASQLFGKTTYDRKYDNGCLDYWWKTKKTTLRIMRSDSTNNSLSAYFSQNR